MWLGRRKPTPEILRSRYEGTNDIIKATLRNRQCKYAYVSEDKLERMRRKILSKVAPVAFSDKEHFIDVLSDAFAEQERSIVMVTRNFDLYETANLGEW